MAKHYDLDGDGRADRDDEPRRYGAVRTGLTAATLRTAMGATLSLERYAELLPAFTTMLVQANATTVKRAAMIASQVGHESVGLKYGREIWGPNAQQLKYDPASGSSLSKQLGNTNRGDGYKYRGAGWLQVTGANNFRTVSQWAFDRGLVPTATYFLDHPDELGSDRYVYVGPTWYWTSARPTLNAVADKGDVTAATRLVNGGVYGLDDRVKRYNACLALGSALLPNTVPVPAAYGELMQDKYPLIGADWDIWDVACGSGSFDGRRLFLGVTLFAGTVTGWVDFQNDTGGVGKRQTFALTVPSSNLSPRWVLEVPSGTTKARIGWDATKAQKANLTITGGK